MFWLQKAFANSISHVVISTELILSFNLKCFVEAMCGRTGWSSIKVIVSLYYTNRPQENSIAASECTAQSQTARLPAEDRGYAVHRESIQTHSQLWARKSSLFPHQVDRQLASLHGNAVPASSDVCKCFLLKWSSHSFRCFVRPRLVLHLSWGRSALMAACCQMAALLQEQLALLRSCSDCRVLKWSELRLEPCLSFFFCM